MLRKDGTKTLNSETKEYTEIYNYSRRHKSTKPTLYPSIYTSIRPFNHPTITPYYKQRDEYVIEQLF